MGYSLIFRVSKGRPAELVERRHFPSFHSMDYRLQVGVHKILQYRTTLSEPDGWVHISVRKPFGHITQVCIHVEPHVLNTSVRVDYLKDMPTGRALISILIYTMLIVELGLTENDIPDLIFAVVLFCLVPYNTTVIDRELRRVDRYAFVLETVWNDKPVTSARSLGTGCICRCCCLGIALCACRVCHRGIFRQRM